MSVERWRCFVAIPIGEALRGDLRTSVDGWRGRGDLAGLRWTHAGAWHVTLAFLGSIDAESVAGVVERLATVAEAHSATTSVTGGLGGFPAPGRARVAWYGIEDAHGRLARLAADVAVTLELDASRPLRPHLTLARARRAPVDLRTWLASASAPTGVLAADRIELVRSHLGGGPARYETLAAITLGVPARV
jgi:2'-5' RNA ligase